MEHYLFGQFRPLVAPAGKEVGRNTLSLFRRSQVLSYPDRPLGHIFDR